MSEFDKELNNVEEKANVEEDVIENDNHEENEATAQTEKAKSFVFDWLEILVHAIIAVVICFSFLFRIATIDGPSMMDTLYHGEKVVITNMFYEPKVGDIVVISRNKENSVFTMTDNNTPIIKRVIALEGQQVNIKNGKVYVDGVELDEPYVRTSTTAMYDIKFPVIVDEGCVFVLGDNRNQSLDSRSSEIGMVDKRYILGHAIFRVLPFDKAGKLD